jgi:hypothetical protein
MEKMGNYSADSRQGEAAASPPPDQKKVLPARDLHDTWRLVMDRITQKAPSLAPHLAGSRLLGVDEDILKIEVTGRPFNLSRVKLPKSMETLKEVCSRVIGREVNVSIKENLTEAEDTTAVKKKERQLRAEAMSHPLVGDVMEALGGKVVDVKILEKGGTDL